MDGLHIFQEDLKADGETVRTVFGGNAWWLLSGEPEWRIITDTIRTQ